jgi:hypothetical protein
MSKLVAAYLWAWKNYESGKKSLETVRKFYPDADLFINVDYEGDIENYSSIGTELNATVSRNKFQIGYCGNFGNINVGYECWSKESAFEWVNSFYNVCKKTDANYIFILEEDDFLLKPVSMLNEDVSIGIHPTVPSPTGVYRANSIAEEFYTYSMEVGGITKCPGFGAGGGTFLNREHFIDSWDRVKDGLWDNYDHLKSVQKIIGWEDFLVQYILMLGGYTITQNHMLCEHWEVPNWKEYEIVTGLKDHTLINLDQL